MTFTKYSLERTGIMKSGSILEDGDMLPSSESCEAEVDTETKLRFC